MRVRVGMENGNDGRSIAWALEHPGCFAYGHDAADAEANMAQAVTDYADWVAAHDMHWMEPRPFDVRVIETFDVYRVSWPPDPSQSYMIESFFEADKEPLTGTDVERALKMLDWSRQDLRNVLSGLSPEQLDQSYPAERWSINGILKHIGSGEWFYQERIGSPFPEREEDLPPDPIQCLEIVRAHFLSLLPRLEGLDQVLEVEAETWSPRKVLRRALWHERDHTEHIRKLLRASNKTGETASGT